MPAQTPDEKYSDLLDHLQSFESIAVAFSGGVDSSLLLHAAREAARRKGQSQLRLNRVFFRNESSTKLLHFAGTEVFCS